MDIPSIQDFNNLIENEDLEKIKDKLNSIIFDLKRSKKTKFNFGMNGTSSSVGKDFILGELNQILKTRTIERTKYYIKRFVKSLSEVKNWQNK